MSRRVKGILFADYVRMIRGRKGTDWSALLSPGDLAHLQGHVDPDGWYPMEVFERLGNAILGVIAQGNVQAARMWGRFSVDDLVAASPSLVAAGDPLETLYRFKVLRSTFFDFEALHVRDASDGQAEIVIDYGMGPRAEEAAAHQTMGFFERLLEVAGARDVSAQLTACAWDGAPETVLALRW